MFLQLIAVFIVQKKKKRQLENSSRNDLVVSENMQVISVGQRAGLWSHGVVALLWHISGVTQKDGFQVAAVGPNPHPGVALGVGLAGVLALSLGEEPALGMTEAAHAIPTDVIAHFGTVCGTGIKF